MANEYVSEGYKDRLRVAARAGRNDGQCQVSRISSLYETRLRWISSIREKLKDIVNENLFSGVWMFVSEWNGKQWPVVVVVGRIRK